jgi:hypothetical protein
MMMSKWPWVRVFVLLTACLAWPDLARADEAAYQDNACGSCHRDLVGKLGAVVQEWPQSVHSRNHVTCDGWHGGDPAVKREQWDSEEAFKNRSHQRRSRELPLVGRPDERFTSTTRGRSVSHFLRQVPLSDQGEAPGLPAWGPGQPDLPVSPRPGLARAGPANPVAFHVTPT